MTCWMKLVLYSAVASGPLSVILMKGQCLNLLLRHSAVLVQPFSSDDLDKDGKTVTLDMLLPLENSDGSPACIGEELGLCPEECSELNVMLNYLAKKIDLLTIGYIRLPRLYKEQEPESSFSDEKYEWVPLSVEFGIPLFSPKLCNNICKRVVSSQLLQTDRLTEHHDAMQDRRKRLRDICAEYQATCPTAKLLYQKEQPKGSSRPLMNYASGRWNALVYPPPISGALSEHQRLKLTN
nr:uncharacterized protein LOC113711716 [Coffea arabica]